MEKQSQNEISIFDRMQELLDQEEGVVAGHAGRVDVLGEDQ